jgi:hypothetical protein
LLHQVGDLFELNVKLRCQKLNLSISMLFRILYTLSTLTGPNSCYDKGHLFLLVCMHSCLFFNI